MKGGAQRLVIDICNELNKRPGVEAKIAILENNNQYGFLTRDLDVVHCPVSADISIIKKNKVDISTLEKLIREFQPDVIHSHLFLPELFSRFYIDPSIKYFTHCHENMAQFYPLRVRDILNKRRITDWYERNILFKQYYQIDNKFITISQDTFDFYSKVLPEKIRKVVLMPNAIDVARFYYDGECFVSSPVKLVNVGNFIPKKNQIFLVEVMKILRTQDFPAELHLVGDGQCRAEAEKKSHEYGLEDNITFHGGIDQVEDILKGADIYVHSARKEGFGLVLIEAMAAGLPCITLDGAGNRDIIKDRYNGFLLNEDPEVFAQKIMELATDRDLYYKLSDNAKKFSRQFDIKPYIDRLLELYKN